MGRNQFRRPRIDSNDFAIASFEKVQRAASKEPGGWWTRDYLYRRAGLARNVFEDALQRIRDGKVPGWLYTRSGRKAAYCMEQFTKLLPSDLQPTQNQEEALLGENIRRHVLETIDAGLREYHAMLSRAIDQPGGVGRWGSSTEQVRLAVKPYYEHVLALARSGRLEVARDLIPRSPRAKNFDIDKFERWAAGPSLTERTVRCDRRRSRERQAGIRHPNEAG
jgi:hypothetical protein